MTIPWWLKVAAGKLHLETSEGINTMCEKLTITIPGVEPIQVSVDQQIHLQSNTPKCYGEKPACNLKASADQVKRSGSGGVILTLEGNAKLSWTRGGHRADLSADRIILNLATGHIESEMFPCPPANPPVLPVSTPSPTSPPAPSTTTPGLTSKTSSPYSSPPCPQAGLAP